MWLVKHSKAMTNAEKVRRGFAVDASYGICGYLTENMNHILRECYVAKQV